MTIDALRLLPAVEAIAGDLRHDGLPATTAAALAREAIDAMRATLSVQAKHATAAGTGPDTSDKDALRAMVLDRARAAARALAAPPLPRLINATGTVLHTGLGRAALSARAQAAVERIAHGYCQLEHDLDSGERGDRQMHVEPLLRRLTGAEVALAVNNCAGAVVLALQALAQGREVIVSRGELVEIGGSFRVPEIMAAAGCRLIEVGSTNKTRIEDYERAITPQTALLMKVHKSNFVQEGFVAEVSTAELAALGSRHKLPVVVDQGSGCIVDLGPTGIVAPRVGDELAAGADLVSFSGDKLLGGPQAGILIGKRDLIARCKRHPLARALRADKLTLAALAGTLQDYLLGDAFTAIPTIAMLTEPLASVRARAERLLAAMGSLGLSSIRAEGSQTSLEAELAEGRGAVGSGAAPTQGPLTWLIVLRQVSATRLSRALRRRHVVARIAKDVVQIDLRTVAESEISALAAAIVASARDAATDRGA